VSVLLYLARHGETADNARRVFQGQGGRGLNRLGRAQAARLAERFRRAPPTAIVTSDLERAVETATIVSEACGVPVELDSALREVDVGTWTGKSYEEVAELFHEEWAAWESGLDVRRGGGETYAELAERIDGALVRIAARHGKRMPGEDGWRRVLVVSHGSAIKSWVAKILGVSGAGLRALGSVANAGLTIVELDGWDDAHRRHRLHCWNDAAHLEGLVAEEHAD
jgi:probable phosphoglycerate mutase